MLFSIRLSCLLALLLARPSAILCAEFVPDQQSFSEYLRAEAGDVWTAATEHPMTVAIADGTVSEHTYRRYLIQDHKFLDAFSVLLASAVAAAPTLEDRIPGARFLALILGPENTYFERSFEALSVGAAERAAADHPTTAAFIALMRRAARSGSLGEMLGVLVVAEWSYLTWGEAASVARRDALPFWLGEWIDLHSGEGFSAVVAYLRGLLDREAAHLDASALARVRATFLEAVGLERAFWDMAWHGGADDGEAAAAAAASSDGAACVAGGGESGAQILARLRAEPFNARTEAALAAHPYLAAAEAGTLTRAQRVAFAAEQLAIQASDAVSFAALAGHGGWAPPAAGLAHATAPPPVVAPSAEGHPDLFQFLLGGEIYAAPLLLRHAASLELDGAAALRAARPRGLDARAQAYASHWARLALGRRRAAGAAACAVNFPAWGAMCARLRDALAANQTAYGAGSGDEEALAFVAFFAAPIDGLDEMAAAVIDAEGASFEDVVEDVRLLQEYELEFWDAIFTAVE